MVAVFRYSLECVTTQSQAEDVNLKDLENVDFDAFDDMALSDSDKAREAAFLDVQRKGLEERAVESNERSRRGYSKAWVVFCGRVMGVFETW